MLNLSRMEHITGEWRAHGFWESLENQNKKREPNSIGVWVVTTATNVQSDHSLTLDYLASTLLLFRHFLKIQNLGKKSLSCLIGIINLVFSLGASDMRGEEGKV